MIAALRSSFSDRRIAVVISLGVLSGFVVAMLAARVLYTRRFDHTGIAWNLFLAWIPFVLALVVYQRARFGMSRPALLALGGLWLLFFPNAPYIVTDLKHIGGAGRIPVLYDVLFLSAAAWTGLLLGLTSLFLMHAVARRVLGVASAWALVVGVLAASSFGIYLGRVQRWNSWDVFVRPGALLGQVANGFHAAPLALTVLLTSFLLTSYLVFYSLARMSAHIRD
ncbi:MAG TPA: DUF1361 domain-containing protein [Gaiellaceae bacterium]